MATTMTDDRPRSIASSASHTGVVRHYAECGKCGWAGRKRESEARAERDAEHHVAKGC